MTTIRISSFVILFTAAAALLVGAAPAQPGGDLKKTVREIAEQFRKADKEKTDTKAAVALASKTGKSIEETITLMTIFKLRDKGGVGYGATPGPNPMRDGIDAMIRELSRNATPFLIKDVAALEEMGYTIAAMGAIVDAKGPPKTADAKGKKLWHEYAHDAHIHGLGFVKAAASKNPATIKTAAIKVNNACGGCHAFFR